MVPLKVPEPPARVAASLIDPVTREVGVATVVRTGVAWLTTLVSPGSLQAVAVAALLVSPLRSEERRVGKACLGGCGSEVAVTVPSHARTTALVLVKIAALPHVASFGP